MKPRYTNDKLKKLLRMGVAAAVSLAILVGSSLYVNNFIKNREARLHQKLTQDFYSRYHLELVKDGKLYAGLGMGFNRYDL